MAGSVLRVRGLGGEIAPERSSGLVRDPGFFLVFLCRLGMPEGWAATAIQLAVGLLLTPWDLRGEVLAGCLVTLAGAIWLRLGIARGTLTVWRFRFNGRLYLLYLLIVLA